MTVEVRTAGDETEMQVRPLGLAVRLAAGAGTSGALVHELHEIHKRQWQLEDLTRIAGTTSAQVATAKAAIDVSNSQRHQLINQIDSLAPPGTTVGRVYSETVGELCDRLVILDVKQGMLRARGATTAFGEAELLRQHLAVVVAELLADRAVGRAQLPPRFGLKIYRTHGDSGDSV